MFRSASAIAMGVAGLFAASAQAEVLYSWENDAEGWATEPIAGYSTTDGVTDESYAVVLTPAAGWNNSFQTGYTGDHTAATEANSVLLVDVTNTSTAPPDGFLQIQLQLIGRVAALSDYLTVATDGTTTTLEFDYSGATIDPGTAWQHFRIITNTNYVPGEVYVDNFRVVPEPASLALAGLGGLAMLMRRRRA